MDYDLFDRIGEHSTVGIGTFCVEEMLKTGFRKEQIDLGLAFYARPTDQTLTGTIISTITIKSTGSAICRMRSTA